MLDTLIAARASHMRVLAVAMTPDLAGEAAALSSGPLYIAKRLEPANVELISWIGLTW